MNLVSVVFEFVGATPFSNAYFGPGTGPIFLDNVQCVGGETRLFDCGHSGTSVHDIFCDHFDDASVRCKGMATHEWVMHSVIHHLPLHHFGEGGGDEH